MPLVVLLAEELSAHAATLAVSEPRDPHQDEPRAPERRGDRTDKRPGPDHPVWAAAAGDQAAAGVILTELLPRVRNLVRYLIRRDGDVDDITQEALIMVLDGLPSYRGEGAFTAWVDRIVVRVTFNQLRRLRAEPSAPSAAPLDMLPFGARGEGHSLTVAAGYQDMTTVPDEYLSRRHAIAILDRLSLEQRHALVLHYVLGMTVPEIAEHMGAPAETVRSRLRLARQRLREHGLVTGETVSVPTASDDERSDTEFAGDTAPLRAGRGPKGPQ